LFFFDSLESILILSNCMLLKILVKDLIIELDWILVYHIVIQASSNWFNNVTLIWPWDVYECIITFLYGLFHCLLVIESSILMLDKSSNWWLMTLWTFLIEVGQSLIKHLSVLCCSSLIQFTKNLVKLIL
jgi:hypothetical protein